MNAKAGFVLFILAVAGIAVGLYAYSLLPPVVVVGEPATLPIQFTPMDTLAGEQDAATSAVSIYNPDLILYETVTMNTASKETVLPYTSGDVLGFYIHDSTDVSICPQYTWVTVPLASASNIYDNAFQFTIWNVDTDDAMTMDVESDGTAIADGELEDLSTNGWDSSFAYIDFQLRPDVDDTGYVNTDNFLKGYKNNHYFILQIEDVSGAGTAGGWAVFNVLGANVLSFDRNDIRYICFPLSDTDLTRDLQSDGSYRPTGLWTLNLALDLTGFASGMNVTITYDYKWDSDWDRYVKSGNYGADTNSTTDETFIIQY
jgi:hypothetical protein